MIPGFAYTLHVATEVKTRHVNLLLISDGQTQHYCLIKNFSRIVAKQYSDHDGELAYCSFFHTASTGKRILDNAHVWRMPNGDVMNTSSSVSDTVEKRRRSSKIQLSSFATFTNKLKHRSWSTPTLKVFSFRRTRRVVKTPRNTKNTWPVRTRT